MGVTGVFEENGSLGAVAAVGIKGKDALSTGYLRTVCEYVHLNPVRAKLLRPEEPLRAYRWSSYAAYLERPERRAP